MPRKILLIILMALALVGCSFGGDTPEGAPAEQVSGDALPIELTATVDPQALFEGSWFLDGFSLDIFILPEGDFIFRYGEDNSSNCSGAIRRANGTVEITDVNTITLSGTSTCENSDGENPFSLELIYDPQENVLRDTSGNAWVRS